MRSLFVLIAIGLLFAGSFATADGVEGQIFRRQSNATAPCRGATACPKAFAYAQALCKFLWPAEKRALMTLTLGINEHGDAQ